MSIKTLAIPGAKSSSRSRIRSIATLRFSRVQSSQSTLVDIVDMTEKQTSAFFAGCKLTVRRSELSLSLQIGKVFTKDTLIWRLVSIRAHKAMMGEPQRACAEQSFEIGLSSLHLRSLPDQSCAECQSALKAAINFAHSLLAVRVCAKKSSRYGYTRANHLCICSQINYQR